MKYLIVMRVFDNNPPNSNIHDTMRSLIKSKLFESQIDFEFHLFDGGSSSINYLDKYKELNKLFIHETDKKITKNENWLRSIEYAKEVNCEYIISLEDDLLFCKKWIESVDKFLEKYRHLLNNRSKMFTFYSSYKEVENKTNEKAEYWKEPYSKFYGTQCILFTKENALKCADHIKKGINDIKNYPFKFRKAENAFGLIEQCIDLWMQEWGQNTYPDHHFIASCPAFVQHMGRKEGRRLHQSHFLGEEWSYC